MQFVVKNQPQICTNFHELVLTFLNHPILRGSEMEIFTWKW